MTNTMIETTITEVGLVIREEQQNERRTFNDKGEEIEYETFFGLVVEEIQEGSE